MKKNINKLKKEVDFHEKACSKLYKEIDKLQAEALKDDLRGLVGQCFKNSDSTGKYYIKVTSINKDLITIVIVKNIEDEKVVKNDEMGLGFFNDYYGSFTEVKQDEFNEVYYKTLEELDKEVGLYDGFD